MNSTFEVLPVATRDTNGESPVFTCKPDAEHPNAGAFVVSIEELSEGASLVAVIVRYDGAYVLASNPLDRPGTYTVAVGSGLGVERASVSAPYAALPDAFKVLYVLRDGSAKFGIEATTIASPAVQPFHALI